MLIPTISGMADWTIKLIEAAGAKKAGLVGHSMGSLIALDAAARYPTRFPRSLIGVGGAMPVSLTYSMQPKTTITTPSTWCRSGLWIRRRPWRLSGTRPVDAWRRHARTERDAPGVLHNDLAACNDYKTAIEAAAKITAPTTLILGERDMIPCSSLATAGNRDCGIEAGRFAGRRPHADG
jgi:pimeloyl-ACP methyl ester carboxylesterase